MKFKFTIEKIYDSEMNDTIETIDDARDNFINDISNNNFDIDEEEN